MDACQHSKDSAAVQQCLWHCRFVGFCIFLSCRSFSVWVSSLAGGKCWGTGGQVPAGRKYPELLFPKGKFILSLPPELSHLPLESVFPYLTFFCLLFKPFGCHPVTRDIPVTSFGILWLLTHWGGWNPHVVLIFSTQELYTCPTDWAMLYCQ